MAILNRIGPASAFRVGLVVYAVLGFIVGLFCSLIALAGVPAAREAHLPLQGAPLAFFALILCPILYGIGGGVIAVISALLYNLASRWVGGLRVEIH